MTATVALGAGFTRADIPRLCADLSARLQRPGSGDVVCDVAAAPGTAVVTVELLARLALTTRRHGRRFTVVGAGPELTELLGLLGLAGVLSGPD